DYEAVSYTWGTESHNRPITIDEKRFYVSPTLKQALKQFHNAAGLRCLWIDAICINQADLEERNQQIQFMARIYRNSSRLLVWLGVSASNSDYAMKFLEELGDQEVEDQNRFLEWIEIDSIASLISRPWFTRTWILQEFVLA
ncbi:heterokaryon incompatibility, partial [Mollisia scopiformis]